MAAGSPLSTPGLRSTVTTWQMDVYDGVNEDLTPAVGVPQWCRCGDIHSGKCHPSPNRTTKILRGAALYSRRLHRLKCSQQVLAHIRFVKVLKNPEKPFSFLGIWWSIGIESCKNNAPTGGDSRECLTSQMLKFFKVFIDTDLSRYRSWFIADVEKHDKPLLEGIIQVNLHPLARL